MPAVLAFISGVISVILLVVGGHARWAEIFLAAAVTLIALHQFWAWAPWGARRS